MTGSPAPAHPELSVIVATRNRPADVSACLAALVEASNGRVREVILVDDASHPPLRLADNQWPFPVVLVRCETRLGADQARNLAAQQARGSFLGFLDDDARACPDWARVASQAIVAGHLAFTGRVLAFDKGLVSRARQWRYDERYSGHARGDQVGFFAGGNSVVHRESFLRAGGFPRHAAGADNALVLSLDEIGVPCVFVPELRVLHRNSKGLRVAVVQAWRSGRTPRPRAPVTPSHASRSASRRAPIGIASLNGLLQAIHALARITHAHDQPIAPAQRINELPTRTT